MSRERSYVVYTLRDPMALHEVRYVGMAYVLPSRREDPLVRTLRVRLGGHLRAAKKPSGPPCAAWIKSLPSVPLIDPIGLVTDVDAWRGRRRAAELEAFWMKALLRGRHCLKNLQGTGKVFRARQG